MKLHYIFILAGIAVGYGIGSVRELTGFNLVWEIFCGMGVGYSAFRVWSEKLYGILIGMILGLVVTLSLDWLAGSTVDLKNKLSYMFLGSFIGWLFYDFWREILVGGLIALICGFVWGLNDSHWFGIIRLPAGVFNGSLLGVQMSIIGMAFASLAVGYFGPIFKTK
jgi:hypothetical protein